jgi:hypothetical protein
VVARFTTEVGEKSTLCRNVFAASFVFFFFSLRTHVIYYLGTLRLYTQSCRLLRCPGSKPHTERGFAFIEGAAILVVALPILVLGVAYIAMAYDQGVAKLIPHSLMREAHGGVQSWRSDGVTGVLEADLDTLEGLVSDLRDRALSELVSGSLKLAQPSAIACYWVFNVDPDSGGVVGAAQASGCRASGALANSLGLESALIKRLQRGVSEPIVLGGNVVEFVSQVVLVGVAVGGEFSGLAEYLSDEIVQSSAVWVPREDVKL